MHRRDISKALFASAAGSTLLAQRSEAQTCTAPCYPRTQAEVDAGVTPTNLTCPTTSELSPQRFGAVGDGHTDDTLALTNWLKVLGQSKQSAFGFLPRGTYFYSANLTVPANVFILGTGNQTSIFKPTSTPNATLGTPGVTTALTTSSGSKLHGFQIDGSSVTNASAQVIGLLIGPVGPDYNEVQDVWVQNFASSLGVGIYVQNAVSLVAFRVFTVGCSKGLVLQSATPASLPTTCVFESCRFRTSTMGASTNSGQGVQINSGQQLTFRDCIFEDNFAQGMLVQSVSGGIIQDLSIQDCWFENNNTGSQGGGPEVYSFHMDGSAGSSANANLSNVHFTQGATVSNRKSVLIASALANLSKIRCYYGFKDEIVITGGTLSLVYVTDDSNDRCGRFISSSTAGASVLFPAYLPLMNLGTGFSALPTIEKLVGLAYSSSITPDLSKGNSFNIQVIDTNPFVINAPAYRAQVQVGKRMSLRINNLSGSNVLGTVMWDPVYKLAAWVQPQFNCSHFIEFEWDGVHMVEAHRTTTQVPV